MESARAIRGIAAGKVEMRQTDMGCGKLPSIAERRDILLPTARLRQVCGELPPWRGGTRPGGLCLAVKGQPAPGALRLRFVGSMLAREAGNGDRGLETAGHELRLGQIDQRGDSRIGRTHCRRRQTTMPGRTSGREAAERSPFARVWDRARREKIWHHRPGQCADIGARRRGHRIGRLPPRMAAYWAAHRGKASGPGSRRELLGRVPSPAVKLMKGPLPEKRDCFDSGQLNGAAEQVEVDVAAGRLVEAFIQSAEFVHMSRLRKRAFNSCNGKNHPSTDDPSTLQSKKAVTVLGPIDRGEQGVFTGLVVAGLDRIRLHIGSELPGERGHNGPRVKSRAVARKVQEPGVAIRAPSIITPTIAPRASASPAIYCVRRRRRRRIDAEQPEIALETA